MGFFEPKLDFSLLFNIHNKKISYKNFQMRWRIDLKNIRSIDVFKEKIEKGKLFEKGISLNEWSKKEIRFMFGCVNQ